jgi:hypothetical protein
MLGKSVSMTTSWIDEPWMDEPGTGERGDREPGDAADQAQWLQYQHEREAIRASLAADARHVDRLVEEDLPYLYSHGSDLDLGEAPRPWHEPPLVAEPEADASDDPFHGGGEDVGFDHLTSPGMHIERG